MVNYLLLKLILSAYIIQKRKEENPSLSIFFLPKQKNFAQLLSALRHKGSGKNRLRDCFRLFRLPKDEFLTSALEFINLAKNVIYYLILYYCIIDYIYGASIIVNMTAHFFYVVFVDKREMWRRKNRARGLWKNEFESKLTCVKIQNLVKKNISFKG